MKYLCESRIDLAAIRYNLERIRERVGAGVEVMAVVKADAYGHGMAVVGPFLASLGVTSFAVDHVYEARVLREHGVVGRILSMLPNFYADRDSYGELDLECIINGLGDLDVWRDGPPVRGHLFVDTGMGREGVMPGDFDALLAAMLDHPQVTLTGIMTHFAAADEPDQSYARKQLDLFNQVLSRVPASVRSRVVVHAANSGGTLNLTEAHFDMVRPGMWLYGHYPGAGNCDQRPAMSIYGRVTSVKDVPAWHPVGYGFGYRTTAPTRLGVISVGYADGYPRQKSGRGRVWIKGKAHDIVGRVSMSMIVVDLGRDSNVCDGDEALVLGGLPGEPSSIDADAADLATITYERCCQLGLRLPRVYLNGNGELSGPMLAREE